MNRARLPKGILSKYPLERKVEWLLQYLELLEEIGFELLIGIHEAYSVQVDQLIFVSKNMIFTICSS